ncbi:MAG: DNA topoisomerase IV subunit A [Pseudomonadota bacterium]
MSTENQTDLFGDEPSVTVEEVINAEVAAETASGTISAQVEFSPLPPLPEGDAILLTQFSERAYLEYAMSVVKGRALPELADGQKPVQRRILYAMREMGLSHDKKHVKSARVVGDVLGKFHPHGDSSAYEAMVRMAQSFSLRYPLMDGQGNFGSRDGDNAAAMRYTEIRLSPIAELLLAEIDMDTVAFGPNYDGAFKEPKLLPARLPFVLLNGASGIAVGMATEIPSHNLREVAAAAALTIRQPDCSNDAILDCVTGPDLPGGAQIISSHEEIRAAYCTGYGKLRIRARWTVEELARGQWRVIIGELPHGVSARTVLEEIEALTNPKVKAGKKTLSQDQADDKNLVLSVLESVVDESDKSTPVRLVLEPRSSRVSVDDLMAVMLAKTSLEVNLSINMVMLGLDGRPRQKGLTEIIREWAAFRIETIKRRTAFRLSQVNDRLHILQGRMVVFLNLDEVIRIIRESDDPKAALMERFGLSERQTEDILEIRLRQLARMEGIKIETEIAQLEKEKKKLERLLGSENALREQAAKEVEEDAEKYGDARRTVVCPAEKVTAAAVTAQKKISNDPVTVIVSQRHWVRTRQGHGLDLSGLPFKEGDKLLTAFECRLSDQCIVLAESGRVINVPVSDLPSGRGDGVPIASLIDLSGSKIAQIVCGNEESRVLIATSGGYGFTCQIKDMMGRNKAGKQFITVDGAAILTPVVYRQEDAVLWALSSAGRMLGFPIEEMKALSGGGKGVIIMGFAEEQEALAQVAVVPIAAELPAVTNTGRDILLGQDKLTKALGKRAKVGKLLDIKGKVAKLAI